MLYGYREKVDNRVATLVVAADTKLEFENFLEVVIGQRDLGTRGSGEPLNFEEIYTSVFLQHLTEELYKGYKFPVHVMYHTDEAQRDAFIEEFKIRTIQSALGRDRQKDMQFAEQQAARNAEKDELRAAEARGEEITNNATKTIAELYGLEEGSDKWDRRSEEEKQSDRDMQEKIKKAQKEGKMSGDSFTGGKHHKPNQGAEDQGNVHVTDIVGDNNADGGFDISNVRAVKLGGAVDTELKEQRVAEHEAKADAAKKGKRVFSPEDFAAVLKGDGSADHLNVKGDQEIRRGAVKVRPSLSDEAEQARKEYAEEQKSQLEERARQLKREQDNQAKAERDKGIFRGADLGGDDDIQVSELSEELRKALTEIGVSDETLPLKDYPFNSELGGRYLFPSDGMLTPNAQQVVGGVNIETIGTMSMGEPFVIVVEKKERDQEAWVIYQKMIPVKATATEEPTTRVQTSLVRIR